MRCLKAYDFKRHRLLKELVEAAEVLGYETVSDMLCSLYFEEELTSRQMSNKLGFSAATILKYLRKMSAKDIRNQGGVPKIIHEQNKERAFYLKDTKGMPYGKIAKELSVSKGAVRYWMKKRERRMRHV